MSRSDWPKKKAPFTGRPAKAEASWCSGLNRQSLGRRRHHHRSDSHVALNRINNLFAGMAFPFGKGLWGAWPVRRRLELYWGSNDVGRNSKGNMVRGRGSSHRRRNRPDVARAGCRKGRSLFRAGARGRACAAGKVLGAADGDEPGAALAGSAEAVEGRRSPRAGLRLVHRRLRHARLEGGEGAAG